MHLSHKIAELSLIVSDLLRFVLGSIAGPISSSKFATVILLSRNL
ncbi:unnamed protein product, partial [Tenebrio molitor]